MKVLRQRRLLLPDDHDGKPGRAALPRRSVLARLGSRSVRVSVVLLLFTALGAAAAPGAAAGGPPPAVFIRQWGTYGGGPGQFNLPAGVAADGTDVYVADFINQRVQWFTSSGTFLKSMSSDPNRDFPYGVALSGPHSLFPGDIYVGDSGNRIDKLTGFGGFIQSWGGTGTGPGQLDSPLGVATDTAGDVYVADNGNNRVQEFNAYGGFIRAWGTTGTGPGQFSLPWGVAVDAAGNVYVSDSNNNRIQKFTGNGTFLASWGTPGTGPGQFQDPEGIAVDQFGNVYVADWGNDRIQQFASDGTFLQAWGTPGPGPGQFQGPTGVAAVSSGSLTTGRSTTIYVTDYSDRVEEFFETTTHTIPCTICR